VKNKSMWMLAAFAAGSLYAQPATTEAAILKQAYAAIKGNLTKAAEKMPEDQYGFKASPDIRTFGALIGHVADVQGRICAAAAGSTAPASAGEKTAKADLVAALNASFAVCDGVFDSLTDADASKTWPNQAVFCWTGIYPASHSLSKETSCCSSGCSVSFWTMRSNSHRNLARFASNCSATAMTLWSQYGIPASACRAMCGNRSSTDSIRRICGRERRRRVADWGSRLRDGLRTRIVPS